MEKKFFSESHLKTAPPEGYKQGHSPTFLRDKYSRLPEFVHEPCAKSPQRQASFDKISQDRVSNWVMEQQIGDFLSRNFFLYYINLSTFII